MAAIGVGLPIEEPTASMIVDIGGGTTEVAIISLSNVVYSKSVRIGGDEFDNCIAQYMKRAYNLIIGERTAEEIKINIGSAYPLDNELVTSQEIREALSDSFKAITDVIHEALELCPPELSADLVDRGIVLAGGGALIRNLNLLVTEATGIPCFVADDPLRAVVNGTAALLQNYEFWTKDNS